MGYFSHDKVVNVVEPDQLTLVNKPNFVTFDKLSAGSDDKARMTLSIERGNFLNAKKRTMTICITEELSDKQHIFYGKYSKDKQDTNTFLIVEGQEDTLQSITASPLLTTIYNLRDCMLEDSFIRNNFDILVRPKAINVSQTINDSEVILWGGAVIELVAKESGNKYNCKIEPTYGDVNEDQSTDVKWVKGMQTDIRFNLEDVLSSPLPIYLTWGLQYRDDGILRVGTIVLAGVAEVQSFGEFRVVYPTSDKTIEQAALETLKNLMEAMQKQEHITYQFSLSLNEELLTISCTCLRDSTSEFAILGQPSLRNRFDSNNPYYYSLQTETKYSQVSDSISDVNIDLDIYHQTGFVWGRDQENVQATGTYLTTLSKMYYGKTTWFDLNALMSKKVSYSPPFAELDPDQSQWIDTGTLTDYRFVARRTNGSNINTPIYWSDVLYVLNGYDYALNNQDSSNLATYALDLNQDFRQSSFRKVKPLTSFSKRTHIEGQKQYFNQLIKSCPQSDAAKLQLALKYSLYTQSGRTIAQYIDPFVAADQFYTANTCLLQLDRFLPSYADATVGRIDVSIVVQYENDAPDQTREVSEAMTFQILPTYLHTVNDFLFLNRLGGWDSVNFGGNRSQEYKTSSSTYYRTLTPNYDRHSQIESLAYKTVEEQHIVQTSLLTKQEMEWLRELSLSPAVYELATQRYVLIEDQTIKYNDQDDLFQLEIKYHYTDVFNGQMK